MLKIIFLKILNMSIAASLLLIIVIPLRSLLKRIVPRQILLVFWVLVGVRLILPVSIGSDMSFLPARDIISLNMYDSAKVERVSGMGNEVRGRTVKSEGETDSVDAVNNAGNVFWGNAATNDGSISDGFVKNSSNNAIRLLIIGSVIWLAGIAVSLIYGLIRYIRIKRKVHESIPINALIFETDSSGALCVESMSESPKKTGKRKPCKYVIRVSEHIESPFVLGVLRPIIYTPIGLSEEELRIVLLHEKEHLKHLDHIWKALGFMLLTFYWFNPFVWIAYALFCRDIETACDERVISDMGLKERKKYANALISCGTERSMLVMYHLAFGGNGMKDRVKNVLNIKKPALWTKLLVVVSIVLLAIVFLTVPKNSIDSNTADDLDGVLAEKLEDKGSLEGEKAVSETVKSDKTDRDDVTVMNGWSVPGEYPVRPGTDKWKALSYQEALAACNMPEGLLKEKKSDELFSWVIKYPFLGDIAAFDRAQWALSALMSHSNICKEFLTREDTVDWLIDYYKEHGSVTEGTEYEKCVFIRWYFETIYPTADAVVAEKIDRSKILKSK